MPLEIQVVHKVELSEKSINLLADCVSEWLLRLERIVRAGGMLAEMPRPAPVVVQVPDDAPDDEAETDLEEPATVTPEADEEPGGGQDAVLAAAPRVNTRSRLTAERLVRLVRMKRAGAVMSDIWLVLNDMPGEAISSVQALHNLVYAAKQKGLVAQVEAALDAQGAAPRVVRPSVAQELLARDAAGLQGAPMDFDGALDWAFHNKVDVTDLEINEAWRRINEARRAAHLPDFILVKARGPAEKLPAPTFGGGKDVSGNYSKPKKDAA